MADSNSATELTDPGPPEPPLVAEPAKTRKISEWAHGRPLLGCRFDPLGEFVVSGAQGNTLQRWELPGGKKTEFAGHDSWVRALDWTADGATLLSAGYDGRLVWWAVREEKPRVVRKIQAHDGWVRALAVSPDQQLVATCGNDNLVKLWQLADGKLIATLSGHERHVYNVAFHPSGEHLVSADLMGVIKAWDVGTGKLVREFNGEALHGYDETFWADIGGARGLDFSADGKHFACAGVTEVTNAFAGQGKAIVLLYDWKKSEPLQKHKPKKDFRGVAWQAQFHPDGYLIALLSGHGGGALAFFKPDQPAEFHLAKLPSQGHDFHLAPDGLSLAVAHYDRKLRLYRMAV